MEEKDIKKYLDGILSTISDLPAAIQRGFNHICHEHDGTFDHVDMTKRKKEMAEDRRRAEEMENLRTQVREISKQTKYIWWTMIATVLSSVVSLILQIAQNSTVPLKFKGKRAAGRLLGEQSE